MAKKLNLLNNAYDFGGNDLFNSLFELEQVFNFESNFDFGVGSFGAVGLGQTPDLGAADKSALGADGPVHAPTILGVGDIAFIQYNSDTAGIGDTFTFLLLVDITGDTVINFNETGYNVGTGAFQADEGGLAWTPNLPTGTIISAGTAITITDTTGNNILDSATNNATGAAFGTVTDLPGSTPGLSLNSSGDGVFAYQGALATANLIYGLNFGGEDTTVLGADGWNVGATIDANESNLPDELNAALNGGIEANFGGYTGLPADPVEVDNGVYTGPTTGTREEILNAIADISNWTFANASLALTTFPAFTVEAPVAPLFSESFETDGNGTRYTTSIPELSDGSGDFYTRTDGTNITGTYNVTGEDGSFYFALMDTDGDAGGAAIITMTFSAIDITGYENLSFSGLFAEDDATDGLEDWDANVSLQIEYSIDGGAFQDMLSFESTGGTNTGPAQDTDFDGVGDGTALTSAFSLFTAGIVGTGASLVLRVTARNFTAGDEDISFDNLQVTGDLAPPNAAPVSAGLEAIALSYQESGGAQNITAALTLSDADDTDLESAAVSITAGFDMANDSLVFVDQNGIAGSYAAATGILTLTGTSSVANYQTAIRSITYENAFTTESTIQRTISIVVNDGDDDSAAVTRDINFTINETHAGTSGDDILSGGFGADVLIGIGGSDQLFGEAGDDTLLGGDDNDILDGGLGADTLNGGAGLDSAFYTLASAGIILNTVSGGTGGEAAGDTYVSIERFFGSDFDDDMSGGAGVDALFGRGGDDTLSGGAGDDVLIGGLGVDTVNGGADNDLIRGNEGNDILGGDDGNDRIFGGAGDDIINGGAGNDTLWGEAGADTFDGGSGIDRVLYSTSSAGVTADLAAGGTIGDAAGDSFTDVENLYGSQFDDVLTGDAGNNLLVGLNGNDTLNGAAGNDRLIGGDGDDTLNGDDGNDLLLGGTGVDTMDGGAGNDRLFGGDGDDVLNGGDGNDSLWGQAGTDTYDGGAGIDRVLYSTSSAGVNADLSSGGTLGDANGDTYVSIENLYGSQFDDQLIGDGADNLLVGLGGADLLSGGAGNDRLIGGAGADILSGGAGNDTLVGQGGADVYMLSDGNVGTDRLVGWEDGIDIIEYNGSAAMSFGDLIITQVGANTIITSALFTGTLVVLASTAADFTAADFNFINMAEEPPTDKNKAAETQDDEIAVATESDLIAEFLVQAPAALDSEIYTDAFGMLSLSSGYNDGSIFSHFDGFDIG